jgi:hypothetical protein
MGPATDNNHLILNVKNGATLTNYTYDGNGLRRKAVENGVTTVYIGDYYQPFQVRWRSATRTNSVLTWLLAIPCALQGASQGHNAQRYVAHRPAIYTLWAQAGQISEEQLGIYF